MNSIKGEKWAVVINDKENALVEGLSAFRKILLDDSTFSFVATIIHNKDISPDGTPKRPHLHAYIETHGELTKASFLKVLAEKLKCDKEQISINPSNSELLPIQYLTHKNDKNKFQYDFAEISSTNAERLENLYNATYTPPQDVEKEFLSEVKKGTAISTLCDTYGLAFVNKFRGLVKDIQTEDDSGLRYALSEANGRADLMQDFAKTFKAIAETILQRVKFCLNKQERAKLDLDQEIEKFQDISEQFEDY